MLFTLSLCQSRCEAFGPFWLYEYSVVNKALQMRLKTPLNFMLTLSIISKLFLLVTSSKLFSELSFDGETLFVGAVAGSNSEEFIGFASTIISLLVIQHPGKLQQLN